jgi:hypothetical protein
MLADIDLKFKQHDETVRRAEANATLMAALTPGHTTPPPAKPRRRLWNLLRRIAGSPATA